MKIYSTPSCTYCNQAKTMLTEKGIKYQDVDISKDLEEKKKMIEYSGQMSVPVFDIDGKILVGYNKALLLRVLAS